MRRDFDQAALLLLCSIECSWLARRRRVDREGARGASHGLISAIYDVRGNQRARVGQRNRAICGDLVCQRWSDRGGGEITVVTVDDKATVGLAYRTVPEFSHCPIIHVVFVSQASVRRAAKADVTNIRPFASRVVVKIQKPSMSGIIQ